MSQKKISCLSIFLGLILFLSYFPVKTTTAGSSGSISFIILSKYSANVDIGSDFYIVAATSNGKLPAWKSSNSSIASVNTYGKVTAKKFGTVTITAKIKNAEASCKVTVNKTKITISKASASLERGEKIKLSASASTGSKITWKSSKSSVASVDEDGNVTALKPGETTLTASADGSIVSCKITVKVPSISLSNSSIKLYRNQKFLLTAKVSSGIIPVWKSNRKSVAIVDERGNITAVKNGNALISATVDGVVKTCEVIVEKPVITLSKYDITLKKGASASVIANVASGNVPVWSSSNSNVATVNASGQVTALKKGTAYVYASEDGTKVRCTVHVID